MTYPQQAVVDEVEGKFVAAKLESAKTPELARKLGVRWLPALLVVDADERPASSSVGFLPAADLLTELTFGRAILEMGKKRYDQAHLLFQEVTGAVDSERAPEAAFWWGVSRYRQLKDFPLAVREPWELILQRWPRSQWARKVGYARKYQPA